MLRDDKDIYVEFKAGQYIFSEKHIDLRNLNAPTKRVHINGNGAVIIPSGRFYKDGDTYEGSFSFRNSWMNNEDDIGIWTKVKYAEGIVEVIDENKKQCRIKTKGGITSKNDNSNSFIMIPHWYQSSIYSVDCFEGDFIYFTASDLKLSYQNGYNINNDYNYGGKEIRYKLCNVEGEDGIPRVIKGKVYLPSHVNQVWEGWADNFMSIQNSNFESIEIKGLTFYGNSSGKYKPLVSFQEAAAKDIVIKNCSFVGIKSEVFIISSTSNISITDNRFQDCYSYGIYADNASGNIDVKNNSFNRMGKRMQNTFCVRCEGPNFKISDNTFTDFGYGGVAAGIWYGADLANDCSGIIEKNHIYNTKHFNKNINEYGIMDGGAIYLFTKNNGVKILNNYIHDISGIADNRGIFCDDGAYGYEITGNVIKGIENSYCIDTRRCPLSESKNNPQSSIKRANVNITIKDNVIGGYVRFEGHEEDSNGCEYGPNYFLLMKGDSIPQNTVSNVKIKGGEVALVYTGEKKERIGLNKSSYRLLKNSLSWKHVKKYVIRKDN